MTPVSPAQTAAYLKRKLKRYGSAFERSEYEEAKRVVEYPDAPARFYCGGRIGQLNLLSCIDLASYEKSMLRDELRETKDARADALAISLLGAFFVAWTDGPAPKAGFYVETPQGTARVSTLQAYMEARGFAAQGGAE